MNNQAAIESTIRTYFECMYEPSAQKAHSVYHPDAKIAGYMDGELQQMTVNQFAEFVATQASAKAAIIPARLDMLSIDVAGDTAVARVRDDYLGMTFIDTLSLIRVGDGWPIYTKLFHAEGRPAGR